jgi:hypothetical protein
MSIFDTNPTSNFNFGLGTSGTQNQSLINGGASTPPAPGSNFLSWDSFLGGKSADGAQTNGWGGAALGVAQGIGNAYMGMKQYGLAKESLAENKRQFQMNFNAQKKTLNTQMDDRQRARVASNSGAYESVDSYMKKNGI